MKSKLLLVALTSFVGMSMSQLRADEVVEVSVPGMSCAGCASSITSTLSDIESITDASVILKSKVALFRSKTALSDKEIKEAIEDAGYEAVKITRLEGVTYEEAKAKLDKKPS